MQNRGMPTPRTTRYFAVLLWLLMVLMPVRGMALGWMQATMPLQAAQTVTAENASLPPCHAMAADAVADEDSDSTRTACAACDLCHNGVVPTTLVSFAVAQVHGQAPQPTLNAPHERPALDGLFRPPR